MARKMSGWNGPLTLRRYLDPTGPLADVDSGMVQDFTRQRDEMPHPVGGKSNVSRPINSGAIAAHAILTTPDTHGTESPFKFPK